MVISPLEHPNKATGDPWATQPRYANAMAATGAGLIALWALHHHIVAPLLPRHRSSSSRRATALARWLSSRTIGFPSLFSRTKSESSPVRPSTVALGVLLLMSIFFLVPFTVATFAIMPYYRTLSVYGSPPLALRSGFMALGTMPFLYATSAKVSYLNALTGVKTETWLVWHAWGGRFCLFLASVHTIPFIYQALQEGGSAQLAHVFQSDNIYTTGILSFVALFLLVLPSGRFIRERWYALWLTLHIPVALIFLTAMWVHCENILTSWYVTDGERFMYAATFFYLLNIALRLARMLQNSDFLMNTTAELSVYPVAAYRPSASASSSTSSGGALTRIVVPTMARWQPGQHVYIRLLPSLPKRRSGAQASATSYSLLAFIRFWIQSAAHSHPFTIVSLPPEDRHAPLGHMVLLARATEKQSRWTSRLAHWVRLGSSAASVADDGSVPSVQWTVIVDGPFGSTSTPTMLDAIRTGPSPLSLADSSPTAMHKRHLAALQVRSPLARHDGGVLFICGGSGITYALGLLLELVWARSKAEGLTIAQGTEGEKMKKGTGDGWPGKVRFVWTVRDESHIAWAEDQLRMAAELAVGSKSGPQWLEIVVHVTGAPAVPQLDSAVDAETGSKSEKEGSAAVEAAAAAAEEAVMPILGRSSSSSSSSSSLDGTSTRQPPWQIRHGERMDAALVLREFVSSADGCHVGLVVCGPHSLADDASRAAEAVQMDIVRGRGRGLGVSAGLEELEVFREDFGW
ncbi:hypothetical protein OC834_000325 [Tilletia horrida]|nr:hypothetical protein OC834_000325 [Tilletia horrida]